MIQRHLRLIVEYGRFAVFKRGDPQLQIRQIFKGTLATRLDQFRQRFSLNGNENLLIKQSGQLTAYV